MGRYWDIKPPHTELEELLDAQENPILFTQAPIKISIKVETSARPKPPVEQAKPTKKIKKPIQPNFLKDFRDKHNIKI